MVPIVLDPHPGAAPQPSTADGWMAECRRLLAACQEQVFDQPAAAVATARRAVSFATRACAGGKPVPAEWVDLEALAWGLLANAERVASDLEAAEQAMARAEERRAEGSGDAALAARLLGLRASLESSGGRLQAALHTTDEAVAAYLRCGDRAGLGHVLVQKAVFLAYVEDTARSLDVLHQAFEHLVPKEDPRSVLAATQCLAHGLHRMGYDIPAAQLVDQAAELVAEGGDRVLLLRLRWLKVRIQMSLGHEGEVELRRIRDELLERDMVFDAAVACLDLATCYARRRRLPDLRRLAREMFPIFTSRQIHREALAALLLLRDTLSGGRAELPFLEEVRSFLERSRHDHQLRFRRVGSRG